MSQLARKPIFFILIVRPSQEDCEIDSPEEESSETASEENFSKEEPSPEKKAVTPQPHRENPLPKPKPASGGPVVNNNPLNWVDPLGLGKNKNGEQQILMTGNVDDLLGTEPRPGQVYIFTHGQLGPITGHAAVEIGSDPITGERRIFSADPDGTYTRLLRAELKHRSGSIYYPNQTFDVQKLTSFAEQNVGRLYDFSNLIGIDSPGEEICSSAVASCLSAAGVGLRNHGYLISPTDLSKDPALNKIGEFKYGGWAFDQEGRRNFVNENIAPAINTISNSIRTNWDSFRGFINRTVPALGGVQ